MTRWILLLFCVLPGIAFAANNEEALQELIRATDAKAMPKWHLPLTQKIELKPGLRLLVMEDKRLPIVTLHLLIPYGSLHDAEQGAARTALLAKAWRYGGTKRWAPAAFAEALEQSAIGLDVKILPELTVVTMTCLSQDLNTALRLFKDWLFHPRFDEDRLKWAKRQLEAELREVKDYHEDIAAYLYPELVYGKGQPWGQRLHPDAIDRLNREEIQDLHRALIQSGPLWVGVVGDAPGIHSRIAKIWRGEPLPLAAAPIPSLMPEKKWSPAVTLVEKEGDQSTVILGHLGERRFNPDKFALLLADFLLGGETFTSLLGADLRVKQGLVYGVQSAFGFETEYGLFKVIAKTKARHTRRVLDAIAQKIHALQAGTAVDERDLRLAKNAFLSNLLFNNEEKGRLMETLLRFEFYGYPPDYLETFGREIEKVTLADIARVARRYFFPDRLVVLVVGPRSLNASRLGPWAPTRRLQSETILDP